MILTKTQKDALKALHNHSGEGAIAKNGTVIAQGVVLGEHWDEETELECFSAYSKQTWAILRGHKLIENIGSNRIRITPKGQAVLAKMKA
jgi:hypothetical protein